MPKYTIKESGKDRERQGYFLEVDFFEPFFGPGLPLALVGVLVVALAFLGALVDFVAFAFLGAAFVAFLVVFVADDDFLAVDLVDLDFDSFVLVDFALLALVITTGLVVDLVDLDLVVAFFGALVTLLGFGPGLDLTAGLVVGFAEVLDNFKTPIGPFG